MTTTDTDRSGFLAAIRAAPDDDLPRLVYADHLEEHGEPERAEFIRVQCELTQLGSCVLVGRKMVDGVTPTDCGGHCDYCRAKQRERDLWNASRLNGAPHPWFQPPKQFRTRVNWLSSADTPKLFVMHRDHEWRFWFGRGFVARVSGPLAAFGEERECGDCKGTGYYYVERNRTTCRRCKATGRVWTPAPAFAELCRREPLPDDGVTVTDREPREVSDSLGHGYTWSLNTANPLYAAHAVPDSLRAQIPTDYCQRLRREGYVRWANRSLATAALSTALVRAARG